MLVDSGCTDHIAINFEAFLYICSCNQYSEILRESLVEVWAVAVSAYPQTKRRTNSNSNVFVCDWIILKPLVTLILNKVGYSFTFEKRKSCLKLQKGTGVKLTQESILFYLTRSVLEFKKIPTVWNLTVHGDSVIWIKWIRSGMH